MVVLQLGAKQRQGVYRVGVGRKVGVEQVSHHVAVDHAVVGLYHNVLGTVVFHQQVQLRAKEAVCGKACGGDADTILVK